MRIGLIAVAAASALLSGCGGGAGGNSSEAGAPVVKRQPGSWSSKIQIMRFEGEGTGPEAKAQMQQMFDMMGNMSVCLTPEAVAKEDISKNLEQTVGSKNCTFDKKNIAGETLEFSGTCTSQDGSKVRLAAKGKNGATAQDITITVEPLDAAGKAKGAMEMHVTSARGGDCKAGDIKPPAA